MSDTTDVHIHTVKFGLEGIDDTVATLTAQLGDAATIAKEAAEGIKRVNGEYVFANKNLQEWYDKLKELKLAHNQTTVQVIDGMQKAAAATKTAATATEDYGKRVKKANEDVAFSEENKKRAFEDIGRLLEGEKFGLRQIAANFGLLGPELVIVGAAVGFVAKKLHEYWENTDEAARATKELGEVTGKAGEKIASVSEDVRSMKLAFDDAKKGLLDKKVAVEEYNEKFGKTLGYAQDFNTAEKIFREKSDAYVAAMHQRAIADAAYGLAKDTITKAIKAQAEGETSVFDKLKIALASSFAGAKSSAENTKTLLNDNFDEAQKLSDGYNKIGDAATEAARKIDQANGIKTEGKGFDKPPKKKAEHDNSIEEEKRYIAESQKLTESAMQKEVTNENIKYDKIYKDLKKHNNSTEALTEQHLKNLAAIKQKYDDIVSKAIKSEQDKAKKAGDDESAKFFAEQDKERARIAAEKIKDDEKMKKDAAKYLNDQFSTSLLELKTLKGHYDLKKSMIDTDRKLADGAFTRGEISTEDHNKKIQQLDAAAIEIKKQQAQQEKMIVDASVSTLETLSKIAGEHTEAGKDLAIAAATIKAIQAGINTFEGFTSEFPGPVGIALGAVAAAGVGVALFEQVKKIEDVKIPGGAGGGSSSSSGFSGGSLPGAPSIPKAPTTTNLSNNSLNKINQPQQNGGFIKAVVSEQDVTSTQRRVASFNNGSSLH